MRSLKFRAWDKTENKYMKHQYIGSEMYVDIDGIFDVEQDGYSSFVWEQFTGLIDRHGKEIFEGDIIQYDSDYTGNAFERIGYIRWSSKAFAGGKFNVMNKDGSLGYDSFYGGIPNEDCEVIGNIRENPDLLDK
jgi:uncharacterized phage protein (TIGR01671 family)